MQIISLWHYKITYFIIINFNYYKHNNPNCPDCEPAIRINIYYNTTETKVKEYPVYGSSKVGLYIEDKQKVMYKLSEHIGNMRAVIEKDDYGNVAILNTQDYYPYGSEMPGRTSIAQNYRFGYQGQFSEKDAETGFNHFNLRAYNSKRGRRMTNDPYGQHWSPYMAMGNAPNMSVDPDGGYSGFLNPVALYGSAMVVGGLTGYFIDKAAGGNGVAGAVSEAAAGASLVYGISSGALDNLSIGSLGNSAAATPLISQETARLSGSIASTATRAIRMGFHAPPPQSKIRNTIPTPIHSEYTNRRDALRAMRGFAEDNANPDPNTRIKREVIVLELHSRDRGTFYAIPDFSNNTVDNSFCSFDTAKNRWPTKTTYHGHKVVAQYHYGPIAPGSAANVIDTHPGDNDVNIAFRRDIPVHHVGPQNVYRIPGGRKALFAPLTPTSSTNSFIN